jgi:regulatory protein
MPLSHDGQNLLDTPEYKQALARAIRLLTRREHSEQEIRKKLDGEYPALIIDRVIQSCKDREWLNEERFMTVFIRSRAARGYGPLRVTQELRFKGLSNEQIKWAFECSELDWFDIARLQAQRKVLDTSTLDRTARARLQGFLQRRGFTSEQVRFACAPPESEG